MGDLDDDLRRLFSDDRLDVHSVAVSTEAVLRGANRRRRRRNAVAGTFALVTLVGAGIGVSRLGASSPDGTAGALLTTSTSAPTTSASPPPVSTSSRTEAVTTGQPPNSTGGNTGKPDAGGTSRSSPKSSSSPPTPESQPGRYGTLALGMSEADALATGSLVEPASPADPDNRCKAYATKSVPDTDAVIVSPVKGLVRITVPNYAKTPKNVGVGSRVADVKAAYQNAVQSGSSVLAPMSATPPWTYVFETDGTVVTAVFMRLNANDCTSV
ncbi:hypothetical protein SAMN04488074_106274 [Lentzea albidocapillata subsp. violacea]|uniref:Uncharacterized protein n=1 Tax=Lentzea albidocapillata subsp. violacea TaxID=128104 RepID=A0A1G9DHY7_9PSEU|nr:hypothetical protein [Lentzea albidocapillata]SDK63476.1 hypothetical protein SAMN04488074_106274 [Lentzea albidocapillata subsp. violacea]